MKKALNFIGNQWSWPAEAKEMKSVNPANLKEIICLAPDTPLEEVNRAVQTAKSTFPKWKNTPAPERAKILRRAGDLLVQRKEELGRLVTQECGKPIQEGLGDVQEAIDMAYLAAGEGRRLYGETTPSELPDKFCLTFREPIGVCGLITPWNFPTAIPAWKGFHALVCGNTVVFKPAEDTPFCGVAFVKILEEAGLPAGVMNLVHGYGESVGQAMVHHADIQLISFTGSTQTGRLIAEQCGKSGKRVSLECGGKNAQIVMEDGNLDLAIEGALWGAFGTGGQRCTATSRLILHEAIHDQLLNRLLEQTKKLVLGDGLDKHTDVGPIINEQQFNRIQSYIEVARKEGARFLCGGQPAQEKKGAQGYFFEPTILTHVTRSMRIFKEEIFGPVLSVIKVKNLDEAIQTLNDSAYGLSSAVYTQDLNKAMRAVKEIEAGIVYVNGPTIGAEVHLPFGGVKGTGNGHREAGKTGLDIFTEWKTVYIDFSGKLQKAQIDNS